MFELTANFFVVAFAFTGAFIAFSNARKSSTPLVPALNMVASAFAQHFVLCVVWALALNALHLSWASLTGFGVGLLVGLGGLLVLLAFKSWRHRRRHWR